MHRHHIIPKHMGGSDGADNLTPPITVAHHAELHRQLWLDRGHQQDYIAWKTLSGRMTNEEARLAAAKLGQNCSELNKSSRREAIQHAVAAKTRETCSRGGHAAAPKLVEWQKQNAEAFKARCAENGKAKAPKQMIPHIYLGIKYPSKKDLQIATGMSNCGFYGKLARSEIERIEGATPAKGPGDAA